MGYQHLTTYERGHIEALHELGFTVREIGERLKRHHSTIARELSRSITGKYISEEAQKEYEKRRKNSKPKGKYTDKLAEIIEEKLRLTWSPEQIANTITSGQLCFKTIYRWIYIGLLVKGDTKVLRHKGKSQKPLETRGKFNVGTSIHKRPEEVKKRMIFGHWELDTIVSSRGKSKGCFATFAERKTRMFLAVKMTDRTAASMVNAINLIHTGLPPKAMLTATVDRGKEFSCYKRVEDDMNIAIYFADPYSSWQRGTNENSNGLLREFFPKQTNLSVVDEEQLTYVLWLINNRPRKCLSWKSANEVFSYELSHLT